MWSRKNLISASLINSSANVLVPFLLAWSYGVEYSAIWLSFRAFVQILIALIPNPISALMYGVGGLGFDKAVIRFGYVWMGGAVCSLVFIYLHFFDFYSDIIGDAWRLFFVFSLFFLFSSCESLVCRYKQRSDFLVKAAYFDFSFTCFSFVSLLMLPFSYFVAVFCVKELFKGLYLWRKRQTVSAGSAGSEAEVTIFPAWRRVAIYSTSHAFRGGVQVLSQYGDRLVWPLIFGLELAGKIILGSSLGMVVAMLSSSAFAWSIPKIIKGEDLSKWLETEWKKLITLTFFLGLAFFIFFTVVRYFYSYEWLLNISPVAISLGMVFSSVNSVNVLSIAATPERLRGKVFSLIYFGCLVVSYLTIYFLSWLGFEYYYALIGGISVSYFSYFAMNKIFPFRLIYSLIFLLYLMMVMLVSYE